MKRICEKCKQEIKSIKFWQKISYEDKWIVLQNGDVHTWREYFHYNCIPHQKSKDKKKRDDNDASNLDMITKDY